MTDPCGFALFNECSGDCARQCSACVYSPPPLVERTFWTQALYAAGFAAIVFAVSIGAIACMTQGAENIRHYNIEHQEP